MDIIYKITLQNIKKNRKRTIVTVIGILLSSALICAVAGMGMSAREMMIEYARISSGDYHVTYYDVPQDQMKYIQHHVSIDRYFLSRSTGYGTLGEGAKEEDLPHYYLLALSEEAMDGMGLYLTDGRLPENDSEIVLPRWLLRESDREEEIGDRLNLNNGFAAEPSHRDYTIVGFIEENPMIYNSACPGEPVVTALRPVTESTGSAVWNVSVTFKDPGKFQQLNEQILENVIPGGGYVRNKDLLLYQGSLRENELATLYSLAGIVILIIILTSVFVIRNSFHISVAEKSRQYGVLSSVGATSKQIRKSVLFEGFVLGALGIPLGIALGVAAVKILLEILNVLLGDLVIHRLVFRYSIPPYIFALTIVLGGVTIYLSALFPAIRAGRISPMEAIRQNREVTTAGERYQSCRLVKRLFGIGGVISAKNLRRSRKKYRTTVISLVVSMAVFIALSSFVEIGRRTVGLMYTDYSYNLEVSGADLDLVRELGEKFGGEEYSFGVDFTVSYSLSKYGTDYAKEEKALELSYSAEEKTEEDQMYSTVIAFNRAYFERFARELGVTGDVTRGCILEDDNLIPEVDGYRRIEHYFDPGRAEVIEFSFRFPEEGIDSSGEADGDVSGIESKEAAAMIEIPVMKRSDMRPRGFEKTYSSGGYVFVSEDFLSEELLGRGYVRPLCIQAEDPDLLEEQLRELKKSDPKYQDLEIVNINYYVKEEGRLLLVIEIFLYGFIAVISLIGVTNIFNTVSTNMLLRSREFAMLKSVGMTDKEFHRMIRLESILYGARSLMIGIPLGTAGSVWVYRVFSNGIGQMGYHFPWRAVLISILAVFLIVGLTMRYSLTRINRQNMIEIIRSENI